MVRRRATRTMPRRKRSWARDEVDLSAITEAGIATDLAAAWVADYGTNSLPPGITVGGVLLDLAVTRQGASVVENAGLHMGIIATNETTEAQVPRPLTDLHADWMWWEMIALPSLNDDVVTSSWETRGGPISIKARRRLDEIGMRLWVVFQASNASGDYSVRYTSSALMILP